MNIVQAAKIIATRNKPLKRNYSTVKAYMRAYHEYRRALIVLGQPTCTLYTRRNKVGVNKEGQHRE